MHINGWPTCADAAAPLCLTPQLLHCKRFAEGPHEAAPPTRRSSGGSARAQLPPLLPVCISAVTAHHAATGRRRHAFLHHAYGLCGAA